MVYDFDPRTNRENLNSKSYPRRLLEDILTNKIVDSMSFGTASNYFTRSYGPNHRIIYEGVGRLLAELLVDTLDNLEDVEYSQLRAEFVATRLLYLVFPDEDSVPVGDTHEETISFLLQTYEALLQGATKKSVDEVLNDIAEGNAVVVSTIEGYIANIKSSILATTEYNTDGVFPEHRHFAFTDESGLGSTNKPIEYKWGDELHTHDIVDGVIQPYIDADGNSHSHEVYLGIPENIIRLQNNLRKVFSITKPAHIKTGEVASIIDEDIPILAQGKGDVFSPILGIDPSQTDKEIIEANKVDSSIPYYNQNAQYGLVGLSLGGFYQEDMRKAREGVYEPNSYGYVSGKTIRFWRTNIKVADTLVIGTQKLRVIEVSERIFPLDNFYEPIQDENNQDYTLRVVRNLRVGATVQPRYKIYDSTVEVVNGNLRVPALINGYRSTKVGSTEILNDGEPIDLIGEVYFCDLMSDDGDSELIPITRAESGHIIRVSYIEVKVDAQISNTGLQIVKNASSTWQTRDQVSYETVEFNNNPDPIFTQVNPQYASHSINLPAYIVKDMLKTVNGLPITVADLTIKIEGVEVDYTSYCLALEHTNILKDANKTNPQNHVMRIHEFEEKPFVQAGNRITLTYPKAKSEIRRFRELNSLEMTLNAARPTRKVSLSGRGIGQNRVIETTSPISYVLNEPQPVSPYTQEQKIATYSAGSSDLLNTSNQTLNTTYTLNNFSLNQTATQEQVFNLATKTLTTSNPVVSFYELGFRPSYITSVIDSEGTSYAYTLNRDHVLVSGLESEKTLTVSGLSSNPFSADLDWYKGDKLGEGGAFFKHTTTLDLGDFTESTSKRYMQNPLGLASRVLDTLPEIETTYTYTNDKITGVSVGDYVVVVEGNHATTDEIRSVYSMLDTQTSGVEGELTFYEDVVTGYDLDGRDGFTSDYNPHCPQDELLYQDPTLYILGPRSQVEVGQVNTIPTYLYFNYISLNLFGGDGYYFAIYRIDSQGVKQYQTLVPRADSNGFTALVEYPNLPAPNGAPLAYQLIDDGGGGGVSLFYSNGEFADNYTAEVNAEFNHIPNETYYIEVYFEEDGGGADSMHFFSSGTDADYVLNVGWDASADTYRLDDPNGAGFDVTHTYEVTFATNPGEVVSFNLTADPNLTASKETENVGATHNGTITTYYTEDYYPTRNLEHSFDAQNNFTPEGMFFTSFEDFVPQISDSHHVPPMMFAPVSINSTVTFSDSVMWSLLLEPALVTETVGAITDSVLARFNYNHIILSDTVTFTDEFLFNTQLNLVKVSESDSVPSPSDTLTVPTYQRLVPSSNYPTISDDGFARWRSYGVSSSVSVADEPLLVSYSFLPRSVSDTIPTATDSVSRTFSYTPVNESDLIPNLVDEAKAWISSVFVSDTWSWLEEGFIGIGDEFEDSVSATLNFLLRDSLSDTAGGISDALTVPVYQTLVPSDFSPTISDAVNASLHLYLYDSVNAPTDVAPSAVFSFTPVSETDTMITITDTIEASLALILLANYPAITDSDTTYISSTNQTDNTSVSVSDGVNVSFNPSALDYLFMAIKYSSYSVVDNELLSVYTGNMDTLSYPTVNDLQPDTNSITAVSVNGGTSSQKEITIKSSLSSTNYNNTNDDANISVGRLQRDVDYKIYCYTEYDDSGATQDIASAMKPGWSGQDPDGYLSGTGYTDLFPGPSTSNDKYYIHNFYIRSADDVLVFTADQTGTQFSFTSAQTVRLYFYIKYTYTPNTSDGSDIFKLRPAPNNATFANPNGDDGSTSGTGWVLGDLHGSFGIGSNTVNNYYLLPNFSITNTNNEAPVSWTLDIGTRYHLQLYIDDQSPDFELYLEARTDDNGASYNTEYTSSDTLTYTELITKDDDARIRWDHFFTIRRDGFIIWEQDSGS